MTHGKAFKITAIIFAAIAAFIVLVYLRMIPGIDNKVEFRFDRAFNYRMTASVVKNGTVPEVDHLSTYPEGKRVKEFLPTGMYQACALFHRTVNLVREAPLTRTILYFCAFWGTLIFIPAYFISYQLYRKRWVAFLSAFLAGMIPAYLHRTVCYWYRFEIAGVPLLFASLFFLMKALDSEGDRKTIIFSVTSALFLWGALLMWRLSVLFLVCYIIFFLYIFFKKDKLSRSEWLGCTIVITLSALLLLVTPGFAGKHIAGTYGSFPKAAYQILFYKMGFDIKLDDFSRLLFVNKELEGMEPARMFSLKYLSFCGILMLGYLTLYFTRRKRSAKEDLFFVFLTFFLVLTFIFARNKILLGPLVAISAGECVMFALNRKKTIKVALLVLIAIFIVKTGYDAYGLAVTRYPNTKLVPERKVTLLFINRELPKDAVILSYWSDGYFIQTYCNRPTITDGLFESPEIIKRVFGLGKIYYTGSEKDLLRFCKKYGATYLLVPTDRKFVYAASAGVDYADYYGSNAPTRLATKTVLYKLIFRPGELEYFKQVYKNKKFILYRVGKGA